MCVCVCVCVCDYFILLYLLRIKFALFMEEKYSISRLECIQI